jgi:hypothetical protein
MMLASLRVEVDELGSSTNFTIPLCRIFYHTINFLLCGTSIPIHDSFCFNLMVYLRILYSFASLTIPT